MYHAAVTHGPKQVISGNGALGIGGLELMVDTRMDTADELSMVRVALWFQQRGPRSHLIIIAWFREAVVGVCGWMLNTRCGYPRFPLSRCQLEVVPFVYLRQNITSE